MEKTIQSNTTRIQIIDVLRGFALLGIIMVHFTEQYYAGQPPEAMAKASPNNIADQVVQGIIGILIQGKFFTIFSFLFGLSFFIHSLHYRGDILTIYAVLGFGLLVTYKLPDRALLLIALFLVFDFPAFFTR